MSVEVNGPTSSPQAIFSAAVRLADGPPRRAFIELACRGDDELRARVQTLLDADAEVAGSPLEAMAARLNGRSYAPDGATTAVFHSDPAAREATPHVEENADEEATAEARPLGRIGRFRIDKLIGWGGMGNVYLARDEDLSRNVALKFPRLDTIGQPGLADRFLQEARLAAQLSHPNLVAIYEVGVWKGCVYIASQWCDGGDLSAWLTDHPGPQDPGWSAKLVQSIAGALDYCHRQGVLHLDIKPGNVILTAEPSKKAPNGSQTVEMRPLLTDFGVARVIEEGLMTTHSSVLVGTPLYMSPEQATCDRRNVGPASDVFSLGVVLHELLFGRRPFEGDSLVEVIDRLRQSAPLVLPRDRTIPPDLVTICERCLQHDPASRYASAGLLADDLGRYLQGEPIHAKPVTVVDRVVSWTRRPQRIVQAGAVAIGIQLLVLGNMVIAITLSALGMIESNSWELARSLALFVAFVHVPSIASALACVRCRAWAVFAGLALGSVSLFVAALVLITGKSSIAIYENNPLALMLMHLFHFTAFAVQTAAHAAALPAAIRLWRSEVSRAV